MTDMQTSLLLLIVRPSILNPVIHFSTQPLTGEMKCPRLYLCLAHSFPSSPTSKQHMHQHDQMIHFISSRDHIGSSILTSLALHRCHRSSAPSLAQASPPRGPSLQSLRLALHACNRSIKPSLILIFSTLITWLNVMSHVHLSSFIIICASFCNIFKICCSHTCTCGLITCVSHINTISPPKLWLNYQNQTRTFQPYLVLVALIRGAPAFVSDLPFHMDSSCSKVVSQIHSIRTSLLASD